MAEDADEELLARLGVVAANPSDYERVLLQQVEEQAKEAAAEKLGEQGGEDVAAAQDFLRDNDPEFTEIRQGTTRIRSVLGTLEKEIAAVTSARDAFNGSESGDEKADVAETSSKKPKRKGAPIKTKDGGEAMHLALMDERLESLKMKRKQLILKLKKAEKSKIPQENGTKPLQPGMPKGQGSSSGTSRGKEQAAPKPAPKPRVISFVEDDDFDAALDAASGSVETEREKLIRKGVITPFSKVDGFERRVQSRPAEKPPANEGVEDELVRRSIANAAASMSAINKARPTTRLLDSSELPKLDGPTREFRHLKTPFKRVTADEGDEKPAKSRSKSQSKKRKRPQADKKWRRRADVSSDSENDSLEDSKADDDGSGTQTQVKRKRLRLAYKSNEDLENGSVKEPLEEENLEDDEEDDNEEAMDVVLEGGLKIPGSIYDKLFAYQQTGVKWMWELHCQKAGGIIGDEMGLGKTIQVIAFLAALHYSGLYSPSIVICPVTLLRQWKREVKKWYPSFKAVILHDSAWKGARVKKVNKKKAGSVEEARSSESEKDEDGNDSESEEEAKPKKANRWDAMIKSIVESESGLLITTYEQLRLHREKLLDIHWGYAVLDEGHRIRNPDAEVTLVCKQLQTVHRLIMTGAPIQNRLTELWSLFDFVFPGKLGVLPVFRAQFALPIQIGGYANATPLQVSTAYKCAVVLRDLILPYLLRRMKVDVNANLTKKTEHVLFCSLTKEQRAAYRAFLGSAEVEQIMEGNRNSLYGIDILRKICNHPDLLEREHCAGNPDYGNPERSGKLKLVMQILSLWKSQGHRVLVFTQTQQMLDIIQNFAESQDYEYRRMDGSTPVKQRMSLIDEFNESEHVFLFILTTKVGGLGTNLTGANRVIIFDPDWNPSTDMQARERAWRIGQKKDVTIYRLITRGTIEEKVYHRQIYKHFLTNKILKDPQQRRIFKARDMRDLFTLQEDTLANTKTETANLFGDVADILSGEQDIQTGKDIDESRTSNGRRSSGGRGTMMVEHQTPSDKVDGKGKRNTESGDEDTHEEESRILKNLFEANGIHSAMDHDAIMAVSDKEKVLVDQEAGRVAQRAADELRRSRMLRSSDNIAVPTWTGRSGEAGAPSSVRRRFGSTTNTRLVSSSAVQTTTVSNVQTTSLSNVQSRSVEEVRSDLSSTARQLQGVGAGSAAGRALSSTEVLNRMRERQMGALGAGIGRR
ncbi:unnamed protein product [Calypogeia fissa]